MMPILKMLLFCSVGAALLFLSSCSGSGEGQAPNPHDSVESFRSAVISKEGAAVDRQAWGAFYAYFQGQSVGVDDVLMGVAEIKPGQEIHPPHVHREEEFLMIMEGTGEWHLNGKNFPAKAGDVLYSRPHEIHGVKNTGDTVMKFVVWKWSPKK